jgi:hypothetical protein
MFKLCHHFISFVDGGWMFLIKEIN